ncbi:MAG: hypothetical protein HRT90_11740 [Candidatus Margulisbacteria bacterium]|nr:hypothetical protein [Candidatus Margulisiibacteriota bacterium]
MRINSISPYLINRAMNPVIQAQHLQQANKARKTKATKTKKAAKNTSIKDSLSNLEEAVSSKGFEDVTYDPQLDMIEARVAAAKKKPIKDPLIYDPYSYSNMTASGIYDYGLRIKVGARNKIIQDDRFTYFTLIESIIMGIILAEKLPSGALTLSLGTKKISQKAQTIESHLGFYKGTRCLLKYCLLYDIAKTTYTLYEFKTKTPIGYLKMTLVGKSCIVEEINGTFEGFDIHIDPVWDKKDKRKINYQTLKIGNRTLDLTSTSKTHRKGMWVGPSHTPPLYFESLFESRKTKKDHIVTEKKITIGKRKLTLTLKFFDDHFPEPYDINGKLWDC